MKKELKAATGNTSAGKKKLQWERNNLTLLNHQTI